MRTIKILFILLSVFLLTTSFKEEVSPKNSIANFEFLMRCVDEHKVLDVDQAEICINKAITVAESLKNQKFLATAFVKKGSLLSNKKQYDDAIEILNQSIGISTELNEIGLIAEAKLYHADVLEKQEQMKDAVSVLEEGLKILKGYEQEYAFIYVSILSKIGFRYTKVGKTKESMNYLLLADSICLSTEDKELFKDIHFRVYNGLGDLFKNINEQKKSLKYFKKGLAVVPEDNKYRFALHNNIANALFLAGQLDSSFYHYNYVLESEAAPKLTKAYAYDGLAHAHASKGELENLKKVCSKGLLLLEDIEDNYLRCGFYTYLGYANAQTGKLKEGIKFYKNALTGYEKIDDKKKINEVQGMLLYATLKGNKNKELPDLFYKYAVGTGKLYQDQKAESLLAIEAKYNKALDEQKIAEQKLLIQEQKNSSNKKTAGLIGLIIFIPFLMGAVAWFHKQKNEIHLLNRELSHRVKNNLEFISSLLHLQSRELEDAGTKEALLDSENRIQALSAVYKRLYGDDGVTPINLEEYLSELMENLRDTFHTQAKDIRIHLTAQKLYVQPEKATKIGLIVNELVTNSIKYAFTDEDSPAISVAFEKQGKQLNLKFSDNGVGIDSESEISQKSFGIGLIEKLVEQLNGKMAFKNDSGLSYDFSFEGV